MCRMPNIAIDGPAGSGKSTVARKLADRLGLIYIDTGAMFRAVTYYALKSGIDIEKEGELDPLVKDIRFSLVRFTKSGTVTLWCNGEDVTPYLREKDVSQQVAKLAAVAAVREHLARYQQRFASAGGVVMEGRDIGTVILPDAELKFFLTASPEVRLERRAKELRLAGKSWTKEELNRELTYRDQMDQKRKIGPLKKAEDAVVIDCSHLTIEQVIDEMLKSCGGG